MSVWQHYIDVMMDLHCDKLNKSAMWLGRSFSNREHTKLYPHKSYNDDIDKMIFKISGTIWNKKQGQQF